MITSKASAASTPATQWLQQHNIPYRTLYYPYRPKGGAPDAAEQLALDLHTIAKTLVMENEHKEPLIIIMHGDQEVSLKSLARQAGTRKVQPCTPDTAQRHTGYLIGGTTPFATRRKMPVWVQETLLDLPYIHINGGKRGLLLTLSPSVLVESLGARPVDVMQK